MRTIGVVTTSRADFGIYRPVLKAVAAEPGLELALIAAGMHLSADYGLTIDEIEAEGWPIAHRLACLETGDTPEAAARSMGRSLSGFAEVFGRWRPDILVVLGDRFEMHAAALAALPFRIPVAHIHGGELTFGAMDDALRHSMTKLSHLHFASTEEYGARIVQMGEAPWRVTVSGAPSLDNLAAVELLDEAELEARFGLDLSRPPLLVTYHPVSLEYEQTEAQIAALLAALAEADRPTVFTLPNADPGNLTIRRLIAEFVAERQTAWQVDNLGTQAYFSLMHKASAMVGNSSSGIIEAASFELPVVNIGSRQDGRVRGANVIDVGYAKKDILAGIERATSPEFKAGLAGLENPYGDGRAAERIVARLKSVALDDDLMVKKFHDLPRPSRSAGGRP